VAPFGGGGGQGPIARSKGWLESINPISEKNRVYQATGAEPAGAGRWQGAHWRRLCRALTGFLLLVAIGYSWLRDAPSGSQATIGLVVVVLVFGLSEWLFARRMGFEIGPDGVTLRGAVSRVFVPWSRMDGLHWEARQILNRTEYLYVETDQPEPRRVPARAPIRIPTVSCATRSNLPSDRLLGPLLSSPNIRAADGTEADPIDVLERARAIGLRPRR
jgi:hypothetical protein